MFDFNRKPSEPDVILVFNRLELLPVDFFFLAKPAFRLSLLNYEVGLSRDGILATVGLSGSPPTLLHELILPYFNWDPFDFFLTELSSKVLCCGKFEL